MARINLDQLAFKWTRAGANAPAIAERALTTSALLLVGYIKREKLSGDPIMRRSGNLSSHITYELATSPEGQTARVGVIRGVPYARPLEEGSRPHVIRAVNAKALRFTPNGGDGVAFARSVNHPGNRPFRFLRSSLEENRAQIKAIFKKAMLDNTRNPA